MQLLSEQRFDEAIPFLEAVLERDSQDPMALVHLGLCHSLLGDQTVAVDYYTTATPHATGELLAVALSNRGWSQVLMGRSREAVLDASWALEHVSGRVPTACAYAVRSAAWMELADYDQSLADLERAAALLPDSAELTLHRAAIYQHVGLTQEARLEISRAQSQRWAPTYFYHDQGECPVCLSLE